MGGNMTQKELLYVEDAIGHEKSIIKICENMEKMLSDERLTTFISKEKEKHQDLKNILMDLLKEKANGQ